MDGQAPSKRASSFWFHQELHVCSVEGRTLDRPVVLYPVDSSAMHDKRKRLAQKVAPPSAASGVPVAGARWRISP